MDNKLLFFVFVFFIAFSILAGSLFFDRQGSFSSRAKDQCAPHESASFHFSTPKDPSPDSPCEVNVFARCEDTTAVTGAEVKLNVSSNGTYSPASTITDENGKAMFQVTGTGLVQITSVINDTLFLNEIVTCDF